MAYSHCWKTSIFADRPISFAFLWVSIDDCWLGNALWNSLKPRLDGSANTLRELGFLCPRGKAWPQLNLGWQCAPMFFRFPLDTAFGSPNNTRADRCLWLIVSLDALYRKICRVEPFLALKNPWGLQRSCDLLWNSHLSGTAHLRKNPLGTTVKCIQVAALAG